MADKRISQLVERTDIANNDVLPIVASGATTTNKVTISTIQDWMQDNLDVGVTSVGITLGTTGTDVNVTGSPITTSGNITINIPDASASNRGVVTTGSQVFGGVKTFANGFILPSVGGTNQTTRFLNIGTIHEGSAGSNQIGFNNSNNIYFGKGLSNGGVIQWTNAAVRYYTLPDADGTIALASQLDGYVTLGTAQTITAQKTFTTSGSSDTMIISHGSGSGIALDVIKAGNGEAIRIQKTSGSGNAVTITGGTLSAEAGQFSGDVQTATRFAASSGSNGITITPNVGGTQNRIETTGSLPLSLVSAAAITMAAGGTTPQITLATSGAVTLTGALNGTSASFSGNGSTLSIGNSNTSEKYITINSSTGNLFLGGTSGEHYFFGVGEKPSVFYTNSLPRLTINGSTGAATFSSSVTANTGAFGAVGGFVVNYSGDSSSSRSWRLITEQAVFGDFAIQQSTTQTGSTYASRMYFSPTGSVGIGTDSPGHKIDVLGASGNISSDMGNGTIINIDGGSITSTNFGVGIGFVRTGSQMAYIKAARENASDEAAYLAFATQTGAGAHPERMRITSGGSVLVGVNATGAYLDGQLTASVPSGTAPAACFKNLTSDQFVASFWNSAASGDNSFQMFLTESSPNSRGTIDFNRLAGLVRYNTTSDANLKNLIGDSDKNKSIEILNSTRIREYSWKDDDTNKSQIGVIAQELYETYKGAVSVGSDEELLGTEEYKPWGVDKTAFTFHLVAGFQEHERIIKELQSQIDSLKNQIQ
jgi:hypothetical protein